MVGKKRINDVGCIFKSRAREKVIVTRTLRRCLRDRRRIAKAREIVRTDYRWLEAETLV